MLNKVQVDIVRNADCQNSLQSTHLGKYFKLHKSFTCASTQNSINPCKVGHEFIKLANFWKLSYILGIYESDIYFANDMHCRSMGDLL